MRAETRGKRRALLRRLGTVARVEQGDLAGVFDQNYVDASGTEQASPAFDADTADVVDYGLSKGSQITVEGVAYRVRRIEPIDPVTSRLVLER